MYFWGEEELYFSVLPDNIESGIMGNNIFLSPILTRGRKWQIYKEIISARDWEYFYGQGGFCCHSSDAGNSENGKYIFGNSF